MRTNRVERARMDIGSLILVFALLTIGGGFSAVAEEPSVAEKVVLLDVRNMT